MSENATFRIDAQKLANYFDRKDFAVPQSRMRTPLPQPLPSHKIINQAIYFNHESGNIHAGDLRCFVFVSQLHKYGGLLPLSSS